MKTGVITYNLTDRGRRFRGSDRNYAKPENLHKLVNVINSGGVQEKVQEGDMLGFRGHEVRRIMGLIPQECILHNGKWLCADPALKTIYLKAFPDGTVEHEAEFIDNEHGRKCWEWYQKDVGGFSSAIDEQKPTFGGFDYVWEPNYTKNRKAVFDDAANDDWAVAMAEHQDYVEMVFDAVSNTLKLRSNEMSALLLQREQDLMLAYETIEYQKQEAEKPSLIFDAVATSDMGKASSFLTMDLVSPDGDALVIGEGGIHQPIGNPSAYQARLPREVLRYVRRYR